MPSAADDSPNGLLPAAEQRLLWIVRHGQRVDNVDRQWRANGAFPRGKWDDPPLSARGLRQASEVGAALAAEPIRWVFCSPFTRCLQTAQQIVSRVRQAQVIVPCVCVEPGFAESLNACHSPPGFLGIDEILRSFPDLCVNVTFRPFIAADQLPTDERTNFCCFRRVIVTLRHILHTFPGNALIVSHGSPIAACHFALSGELNYPGQCTISKYRIPGYSTTVNGNFHWTDRWKSGKMLVNGKRERGKVMQLPTMGRSVVLLSTERSMRQTERGESEKGKMEEKHNKKEEGKAEEKQNETERTHRDNDTLLWLDEVMQRMFAATNLCSDLNAECVALGDTSHLLEREGLHDELVLRCSGTEEGKRGKEQKQHGLADRS